MRDLHVETGPGEDMLFGSERPEMSRTRVLA
jgi:hypothetical protein